MRLRLHAMTALLLVAPMPGDPPGHPLGPALDPAHPPAVARWPAAAGRSRLYRGWLDRGCTALVAAGPGGDFERYRRLLERRSGEDWRPALRILAAQEAVAADLTGPLLVVGPIGPFVQAYLDRTPLAGQENLEKEAGGDGPDVTLRAAGVNPWSPGAPMVVLSGTDDAAVLARLARSGWLRAPDYELFRDGMRVRYGRYRAGGESGEGAWIVDAPAEVDLRQRLARVRQGAVRADYVRGEIDEARARQVASFAEAELSSYLARLGLRQASAGLDLVLYPDLEAKAVRSDDPRASHLEEPGGDRPRVHMLVPPAPAEPDRIGLARAAIRVAGGDAATRAVADGAALWLAGRMAGRTLDWWVGRIARSAGDDDIAVPPTMEDLLDTRRYAQRSYLAGMPAAAQLWRRMIAGRAPAQLAELLRDPPKAARAARATGPTPLFGRVPPVAAPRASAAAIPFQRGMGLAHEGYADMNGYGSHAAFEAMQRLRSLGAGWVALSPFGFMHDPQRAEISFLREEEQSAGGENDQAILATIAEAHRLGLRVMLKPQIWLHGDHWTGDISMPSEPSWREFFEEYGAFLEHYALLASAGDADMLVVGVEMQSASRKESAWRSLIRLARRLYDGPLTYAANWGEEFERIGFWDALDFAGLDCYYPLAADPSAEDRGLLEGARSAARSAEYVARRSGRPVILTEVGFPALSSSWTAPHDDRTGRPVDPEAQARGYRAIFEAFWDRPWLAGLYWWKWPTTPEREGRDPLFSPRHRPAEHVLAEWYGRPRRNWASPKIPKP